MIIYLSNLGCARNLVDGEIMLGELEATGFVLTDTPAEADTIVVNTCSFIEEAITESVDEILELAEYKKSGSCRTLIVTGCLPERFKENMVEELPEVDMFLGTGAYHRITEAVNGTLPPEKYLFPIPSDLPLQKSVTRRKTGTGPYVYLKITEGCSGHCTYCIIPKLRGRLRSRTINDILRETKNLAASAYKEIIVIGQETGAWGTDLKPPKKFSSLLADIAKISEDTWIRFLYGSPEMTDDTLIQTVAAHNNICAYFDVPIQHVSKKVLKRMGRRYDEDRLKRMFDKIRDLLPDAALRTTVMVGFPGETDRDFDQLIKFVETVRFDHLGTFMYSDADDLPSHNLPDHIPRDIAKERHHALMTLQAKISADINQRHIDKVYPVLIEEQESGLYVGRTFFQAPEVDGITYVESDHLTVGDFASVKITDAFEYDLKGVTA